MDQGAGLSRSQVVLARSAAGVVFALATALIAACTTPATGDAGVGATPSLPTPDKRLVPTVDIAPAAPWTDDARPTAAAGLEVTEFARDLVHPRWLFVLPNGDVLVAETNAPAGKSGIRGLKGRVMKSVMGRAGAGTPSADRIRLLRDADGDGVAELKTTFAEGLHSPFGMALVGDKLFVANADSLVYLPYTEGALRAGGAPVPVVDLPGSGTSLNHHWTKSLLLSRDGRRLFIGVGSNSNVGENGQAAEAMRAAVLTYDIHTGSLGVYADGLRNPVGLDVEPATGQLFAVVNERDELGNNLVPDYLTSIREGAFYGWPWRYWGTHVDTRVTAPPPDKVARTLRPDYALGNHVAPLGLAFSTANLLGDAYASGAFVALHGSWNRKPLNGYKVVFVPFQHGRPSGLPRDVLAGFLDNRGRARGRPVGLARAQGGLLVADDVGNRVWRVHKAP